MFVVFIPESVGQNVAKLLNFDLTSPIPVAVRSKTWVCGRSLAGIEGSKPSGGMDVCLLCFLSVSSLRRPDHSSRGVLQPVECLSVIVKPR